MPNFWQNLPKPIFALAPMQDVTDCAFREIFAKYGRPQNLIPDLVEGSNFRQFFDGLRQAQATSKNDFVMFTEFVNVDGLLHPEGFKRLKIDLEFTENQRPIVAQIWGRDPQKFFEAAKLIAQMGFDGIDINMGCPQDKEIVQKTCAALIREPELAGEIIQATIEGAKISNLTPTLSSRLRLGFDGQAPGEEEKHLPVSVKTRLGYSKTDEMQGWLTHLLKYPLAAITIHARTKQEKSKVPAHWEKIKEAVKIRDKRIENREKDKRTLIIGNGDIKTREEGLQRIKETGCDGVMVARGAFGNPWLFRSLGGKNPEEVFSLPTSPQQAGAPASHFQGSNSRGVNPQTIGSIQYQPTVKERLGVMLEHAELYEKMYKGVKSFVAMRKNFKAYASGFEGASELRAELMETNDTEGTKKIIEDFLRDTNLEQTTSV